MALGAGLAAQIGYGEETTWGTRVAPTRFLEFNSESLKLAAERIESAGLRAGQRVLRSDRWVANRKGIAGDIEHEVHNKGFSMLFKHMLGAAPVITTPGGGTLSRDHTFVLGNPAGLGLTVQVGRPDIGGTVRPFDYSGCKVASWDLSNSVDGLLMLSLGLDGQNEATDQSLASASYPAATELLSFVGGQISIGGSAYDVQDFSLSGEMGLKTDRHFLQDSSLKKEQIVNARTEMTGSIGSEFLDLAAYNRFANGTLAEIVALWEGSLIEAAIPFKVQVTLAACRFDGETPNVAGEDVLSQPLQFKALDNGTDPAIELVYTTTDTAV